MMALLRLVPRGEDTVNDPPWVIDVVKLAQGWPAGQLLKLRKLL